MKKTSIKIVEQRDNSAIDRTIEIDVLKGIGIILIVMGHLEPGTYLMRWLYSFHLFLFFSCSGFLGNDINIGVLSTCYCQILNAYCFRIFFG